MFFVLLVCGMACSAREPAPATSASERMPGAEARAAAKSAPVPAVAAGPQAEQEASAANVPSEAQAPPAAAAPKPPAAAAPTRGPSFDCAKAVRRIDRMICDDATLSGLDRDLAAAYRAAREAAGIGKQALLASQRAFLKARNACDDATCVARAYSERIAVLSGAAPAVAGPPAANDRGAAPGRLAGVYQDNGDLWLTPQSGGRYRAGLAGSYPQLTLPPKREV